LRTNIPVDGIETSPALWDPAAGGLYSIFREWVVQLLVAVGVMTAVTACSVLCKCKGDEQSA